MISGGGAEERSCEPVWRFTRCAFWPRLRLDPFRRSPCSTCSDTPPSTSPGSASSCGNWPTRSEADAGTPPTRLVEVTDPPLTAGNLRMLAYVPANLPRRAPLVVVLHGCTQTAAAYDHGTGWSALADQHGFALLYPEQKPVNHPYCCFDWYEPHDQVRDRGEAQSIRQMIAHMLAKHRLDPARVYITGLSAGGAMTSVMLATYPELFAGGAILAGLPYGSASGAREALASMSEPPSRSGREWGDLVRAASAHRGRWPRISIWHGEADTTVAPSNAEAIAAQWTDLHGLDAAGGQETSVNGAKRRVWRDRAGRDMVELYLVPGMGHGVPIRIRRGVGRGGNAGPFILDSGIGSSLRIARFWGLTGRLPVGTRVKDAASRLADGILGLGRGGVTRRPAPAA